MFEGFPWEMHIVFAIYYKPKIQNFWKLNIDKKLLVLWNELQLVDPHQQPEHGLHPVDRQWPGDGYTGNYQEHSAWRSGESLLQNNPNLILQYCPYDLHDGWEYLDSAGVWVEDYTLAVHCVRNWEKIQKKICRDQLSK